MSFAAIKNSVNFHNSHQRQIDEVTLCEPKSDLDLGSQRSQRNRPMDSSRLPAFCTVKNAQCFFVGSILFLFLLLLGHVWRLPTQFLSINDVFLNVSKELTSEMKLIRESITKNDYKDPQVVCPSNLYTVVGPEGFWSSCYLIGGAGQLTWHDGREYCLEKGGDLVAIESELESKFVKTVLRKVTGGGSFSYWIGATDAVKEGDWFWVMNDRKINYSDWTYNAPDNKNGMEHCLGLFNGRWDDLPCKTKQPVICEAFVPKASDQVKPHAFEKPTTICPLSADFEDNDDDGVADILPILRPTRKTSTTTQTTTTTTIGPTKSSANSTATSCYLFMESKMSWDGAQEYCEEYGGYLAAIESKKENDFLKKKLKGIATKESYWWLGGNDKEKGEGNWIWTGTKENIQDKFSDWTANEPSNGFRLNFENCLALQRTRSYTNHHWFDMKCGMWRPSICEIPNPYYNGSDTQSFEHNMEDYISEPLCLTDTGTETCTNGSWTCYTLIRLQLSWQAAKAFCEARGATLACPDTRAKTDAVYRKAKLYNNNAYYWLGATDQELEGSWYWTKNTSLPANVFDRNLAFSQVSPRFRGADLNCLRMEVKSYRHRMHWNDANCDGWAWFGCEVNDCRKTTLKANLDS